VVVVVAATVELHATVGNANSSYGANDKDHLNNETRYDVSPLSSQQQEGGEKVEARDMMSQQDSEREGDERDTAYGRYDDDNDDNGDDDGDRRQRGGVKRNSNGDRRRGGRKNNDDDDEDDDEDEDTDRRGKSGSSWGRNGRRNNRRDDDEGDDRRQSSRRGIFGRRNRDNNDGDDEDDDGPPEFKQCGGEAVRLHVHKFPNPLVLREGEKLHMAFTAVVNEVLPEPIYARITIKKKVLGLWNRIPCVGRVGSCEYKVTCDKLMRQAKGKINHPCPPPIGKTEREFTFKMPKIPKIVSKIARGKYKVQAELYTKRRSKGELLACSETEVRVTT